ncbi:MAG TPA: Ig-like domain-containing protein, partial [Dongiaceae bacterium]|nr:Ig-like domain-containing protein [Dongiaceae bacterium]
VPVSGNLGGAGIVGAFGTLTLNADGSYSYHANPNVSGVDHFVYTIKDGDGDLSTTTLDITVNKVSPATDTEAVTVNEAALDTTTTGNDLTHGTVTGSNPSSPDETKTGTLVLGSGVTVTGGNDQTGSFGTLHVNANGTFTYTLTSNDLTNPAANDGTNTINGAETFTVTITDAFGNTSTDTIKVNIIDDVPQDFHPVDGFALDVKGATFTNPLDIAGHTGADGFGSLSVDVVDGTKVTGMVGDTSQVLQSNGHDIYWFHVGSEVVGTTDSTGVDPSKIVFELTANGAGDTYTFKLDQTIDNGAGLNFSSLSGAPAGQHYWLAISDPASASGDQLLLTGFAQSDHVNTSSNDIGSNNQWIDSGEGIRADMVTGATGTTSTQNGFDFTGRYTATKMAFNVGQVQGGGTTGIQIILGNPTLQTNGSGTSFSSFLAEANVTIESIVIMNAGVDVTASRTIDLSTGIVSNVHAGDEFIVTGTGSFERLEVDYHSGSSFSVNSFEVVSTVSGAPVEITAPTTLTDGDGDKHTSSSGIDVTLYPTDSHIIDHHTNTTSETINSLSTDKVTSGSDVVIIGTGATTVDLGASGGHDTVVVPNNPSVAVHDVVQNFTDHTAGNAAAEQDHVDLDSLFDSMGVATANRAADVVITQNGANVDLTITGTNLTITLTGHTAANISVGTDHTHDIITGSL